MNTKANIPELLGKGILKPQTRELPEELPGKESPPIEDIKEADSKAIERQAELNAHAYERRAELSGKTDRDQARLDSPVELPSWPTQSSTPHTAPHSELPVTAPLMSQSTSTSAPETQNPSSSSSSRLTFFENG